MYKKYCHQQGFCVRRAEVQNSTVVFQLNFSNNIGFCASISRPNAKPETVACQPGQEPVFGRPNPDRAMVKAGIQTAPIVRHLTISQTNMARQRLTNLTART